MWQEKYKDASRISCSTVRISNALPFRFTYLIYPYVKLNISDDIIMPLSFPFVGIFLVWVHFKDYYISLHW